ncbi:MAG: hypothetical protein V1798_05615 [Pseudomonadota bacterium]
MPPKVVNTVIEMLSASGSYKVQGKAGDGEIEIEFHSDLGDMIRADYVDPDGRPSYAHNTEIADVRVRIRRRSGEITELIASKAGHFEIGSRSSDPGVERRFMLLP